MAATGLDIAKLPDLVRDHMQWCLYLAVLRDGANARTGPHGPAKSVAGGRVAKDDFLRSLGQALFDPQTRKGMRVKLSPEQWKKYFARKLKGTTSADARTEV
jgi:hypothetical protein